MSVGEQPRLNNGVMLASAFLATDARLLCLLYPLLILPSVIGTLLRTVDAQQILGFSIVEGLLEAFFFSFIASKWIRAFADKKVGLTPSGVVYVLLVTIAIWMGTHFSLFAAHFNVLDQTSYVAMIILTLVCIVSLRYYFYFIPALLGVRSFAQVFRDGFTLIQNNRSLPLLLIAYPFFLTILYSGIITGLSPDGRSLTVSLLLDLGSQLYLVLSTYLALGIGLALAVHDVNLASFFEPYIESRFDTLVVRAPRRVAAIIHFKNWVQVMFLALLIWFGNMIQLWNLAPSPIITVQKVAYDKQQSRATVFLTAKDSEHKFRGFKPILFRIAGENGEPLTTFPQRVETLNDHKDASTDVPASEKEEALLLEFAVVQRAEDFENLKDLNLWYGQVKLAPISVELKTEDPAK